MIFATSITAKARYLWSEDKVSKKMVAALFSLARSIFLFFLAEGANAINVKILVPSVNTTANDKLNEYALICVEAIVPQTNHVKPY